MEFSKDIEVTCLTKCKKFKIKLLKNILACVMTHFQIDFIRNFVVNNAVLRKNHVSEEEITRWNEVFNPGPSNSFYLLVDLLLSSLPIRCVYLFQFIDTIAQVGEFVWHFIHVSSRIFMRVL